VCLPPGSDSRTLLEASLRQNVAFVPGGAFSATPAEDPSCHRYLRLNFSNASPIMIREGIRRLSVAVREQIEPGEYTDVEAVYTAA
nr:hypothetical protein [Chloroflexota bacterium]